MKKLLAVMAIILSLVTTTQVFAEQVATIFGTGLLRTGACKVLSVSISAPTAGDCAMIFDGTSDSDSARRFELRISSNTSIATWDAKGADFRNGFYIMATDSDVMTSVVFDY